MKPTLKKIKKIEEIVSKFRLAIEHSNKDKLIISLHKFPKGSCLDATLLLGTYLRSLGLGEFLYESGWRENHSHAWLEKDGLIIDITADQFEDQNIRTIVTYNSAWHSSFKKDKQGNADITIYKETDKWIFAKLYSSYQEIVRNIPGSTIK